MTREEAIKTLRELWRETNDTWYEEVYNMAIEALSAEHKHCWDCKHYEPKYNVCHAPEVVKQVTSKLNNPCDSLLKDDSAECKEKKSKLDLISRADAIEAVAQEWLSEASAESPYVNDDDIGEYRKLAEKLFEDIPSADRPKIVRCKDCERYGRGSCPRFEDFMSNYLKDDDFCSDGVAKMKGGYTVDIEFCSFGERREE